MKKIIAFLSFAFALSITTIQAQTKTASKLGTSSGFSHTDSLMCGKEWYVVSVEELGEKNKPSDKNKEDRFYLSLDGKYELILFGNKKAGTWSRSGQYIYFDDLASGEKFKYKVISVEPSKIKVDFRDSETHSIFEMETK